MGSGFDIKDGEATLRVNPKVYPLERVYATAYTFLEHYHFILDGDKNEEIVIRAIPKSKGADLEKFSYRFFEELISITNYFNQFEKNKDIIGMVLQRALFSVDKSSTKDVSETLRKLQ